MCNFYVLGNVTLNVGLEPKREFHMLFSLLQWLWHTCNAIFLISWCKIGGFEIARLVSLQNKICCWFYLTICLTSKKAPISNYSRHVRAITLIHKTKISLYVPIYTIKNNRCFQSWYSSVCQTKKMQINRKGKKTLKNLPFSDALCDWKFELILNECFLLQSLSRSTPNNNICKLRFMKQL